MTGVLLVSSASDVRALVLEAAGEEPAVVGEPVPQDPLHLVGALPTANLPEVVVLDVESVGAERTLRLAAGLDRDFPSISLVVLGDLDPQQAVEALRAGVRDVLSRHAPVEELRMSFERSRARARHRSTALDPFGGPAVQQSADGRLIAVISPKGGVGKTTLATNIGVGLAQMGPGSTVIVDLDVQFGDVASGLDLEPEHSLSDAVRNRAAEDSMVLSTYLTQHQSGVYVLCAPKVPSDAAGISGEDVSRLLGLLVTEFSYVVVDTAPGLTEHTLAVLDQATDLVLVTSLDLPGVRGLGTELRTLDQLGLTSASRQIVVNLADRRSGFTVQEAERIINARVDLALPRHKDVPTFANQGVPLLSAKRKGPVVKGLYRLLGRYLPPKAIATRALRLGGRHRTEKVSA